VQGRSSKSTKVGDIMTEEVHSAEPLVASMYSINKSSFAVELH
jgi:hypothetical protein